MTTKLDSWEATRTLIKLRNQAPPLISVEQGAPHFPLSLSQERLLALEEINAGAPLYNLTYAFQLKGELDLGVLNRALERVLERQAVLRTSFARVDGRAKQTLQAPETVAIDLTDLSAKPFEQAKAYILGELYQPFNLLQAPGFRYRLYGLGGGEYVLGFAFHHIISDYWSENLFFKELSSCYAAVAAGSAAAPPLPIRYADYAVWQRQWLSQPEVLEFLLDYWRPQLQGLAQPDFPAETGEREGRVAFHNITFNAEQGAAIKDLARRAKVKPFSVLLGAFKLALAEYLGSGDVAVFSPVTNRHRPELQELMGDFANPLILRTDVSGGPATLELLQRVGATVAGAIAYQDLPLELIKAAVSVKLPQAGFSYLNIPQTVFSLPKTAVEPWDLGLGTNDFDLFLLLAECRGGLEGYWKYQTRLFSAATAQTMMARFREILARMIESPDQAVPLSRPIQPPPVRAARELLLPVAELASQVRRPLEKSQPESALRRQLEQAAPTERYALLKQQVKAEIERIVGHGLQADNQGFFDLGMDSLTSIQLGNRLSLLLDAQLPATLTLEYATLARLTDYLAEHLFGTRAEAAAAPGPARAAAEPIAIVGMGCRFPGGAHNLEQFWQLLREGRDSVEEIPPTRWPVDDYYDPTPGVPGKMYMKRASFLQQPIEEFDPGFFGMSSAEARQLDPRHRLLLEVTWEALEDAALPGDALPDRTGIFIGLMESETGLRSGVHDVYATTGTLTAMASGRLAYFLGGQGPNITLDTACSSSLVALHLACQSLREEESEVALCGGVNVMLHPDLMLGLAGMTALAPDGVSKTFDASADGFGRGEGCGILVLKRLSSALADGDHIWSIIRDSAVNHGGAGSGLTVPNKTAQTALVREALTRAGIDGGLVDYIEAHGTGTKLGDPIEVRALADALGERDRPVLIGSVKTNIGHLDAAAGIAGLIKTALALHHEEIPPHLHFQEPNPLIDWANLPFRVPTAITPWPPRDGKPRVAGVSAFGLSGTNAHVILEESPRPSPLPLATTSSAHRSQRGRGFSSDRPRHLLALSAKTGPALAAQIRQYADYLSTHPDLHAADVCYTANTGRVHFAHRCAVAAADIAGLGAELAALGAEENASPGEPPKIAFLFTGQGSQYLDMGRELYTSQPLFRDIMDQCEGILQSCGLETPLTELLYGEDQERHAESLNQTRYTQPALFAIEYALAKLWQSWGIEPAAVIGHSVGEYVAACVAGVFSLADGLKLIAARGRLMQALPSNGGMVAVQATEARVSEAIAPYADQVALAGLNAPLSMVLSGGQAALAKIVAQLQAEGVKCTPLEVSHAFHSPLMEPMLAEFGVIARSIEYHQARLDVVSNLNGEVVRRFDAAYWVEHVRRPVRFIQGMNTLAELGIDTFIETGPKPILLGMGRQCLEARSDACLWLASLYPAQRDDWAQLLDSLASLYGRGGQIDWRAFDQPYPRRKVSLPTYPFQRKRHWVDNKPALMAGRAQDWHPLLGERLPALATSRDIAFQNRLALDSPAYLHDHRVYGQVIVPATAYLEMASSAGRRVFAGEPYAVQNVVLLQPLVLSDEAERSVQLVLSPADNAAYQWQIFSLNQDSGEWRQHVSGELHPAQAERPSQEDLLPSLRQRCNQEMELSAYEAAVPDALDYGPDFQAITQLFQGEKQALGLIRLPEGLEAEGYGLHPVLLDCSLRVAQAIDTGDPADGPPYLPFNFERLRVFSQTPMTSVWSHAQWRGDVAGTRRMDVTLLNDSGQVVAEVTGFSLRQADRQAITGSALRRDWLYEFHWQDAPLAAQSPYAGSAGAWLLIAAPGNRHAAELAELLRAQGETVELTADSTFPPAPSGRGAGGEGLRDYRGVVYFARADGAQTDVPEQALDISCRVLELIQGLVGADAKLDLSLVVGDKLEESVLWGMARTLAWEQPQLNCRCLEVAAETTPQTLFEMIWHADGENQLRLDAQSRRQALRLGQLQLSAPGTAQPPYPCRVELERYGLLDSLRLAPLERQAPQAGQVEVQVHAVGLNFRDVLNALGMLKAYYPPELGFDDPKNLPFGFEAAGTVVRCGDDGGAFQVGDEVIVWQYFGSLASFVTVDRDCIGQKPAHLSFEEAATLPITFLTAWYALLELAGMQAGDKVLIHAAAGGVGQAAIQLARHVGAEVFATASQPKWEFLRGQGIEHIMDSRSLDFADQILEATGGRGVDIVLNSLNGEYIRKNFDVLAENGRFIEMGKIDIWDQAQAQGYRPDVRYAPVDWSEVAPKFKAHLEPLLAAKKIQPLPCRVFPLDKVGEAFQFMAQAKHIGKVVLALPQQQADEAVRIRPGCSYLVTGGLGGLGLKTAQWLVAQGATHIVLSGRRAPSEAVRATLAELQQQGAQIKIVQADVAQAQEVEKLLQSCREFAPLKGIIHSAGVLDDGVLTQQTPERFAKVFAPKVPASWRLHRYSQGIPLDFFVCFSSQSSLLGNGGQINYAAANAFMDALMHQRRRMGLPALSINWGGWSEVGMAKELMEKEDEVISPRQGVELFGALLQQDIPQAGVIPHPWRKFVRKLPLISSFPVLSQLLQTKSSGSAQVSWQQQFTQATAEQQYEMLKTLIKSKVEPLAGAVPTDDQHFFADLNMDSLMSIQLTTRVAADIGISVPVTAVLQQPTVSKLGRALLEMLRIKNDAISEISDHSQPDSADDDKYEEGEL